jgi:hypothetical protein
MSDSSSERGRSDDMGFGHGKVALMGKGKGCLVREESYMSSFNDGSFAVDKFLSVF